MTTHKVFVYGTLKSKNRRDNFYVKGTLFHLGAFPGIKLGDVGNIPGQVVEVSEVDLEDLDRYEGVPHLYVRKRTWAYSRANEDIFPEEVWVYEYNKSTDNYSEIDEW